jgi:DNA polymerase-3 subunit delta
MTLIKRTDFFALLEKGTFTASSQLFLIFGERFLCRETADLLEKHLLANTPGTVHTIDADQEDAGQTLARLMSFSLLPGKQIYRVTDSRIFHSKTVLSEIWTKAKQAEQAGRSGPALRHLLNILHTGSVKNEGQAVFSEITASEWKKLFAFDKPTEGLEWADKLLSESTLPVKPLAANIADRYIASFDKGFPANNILLLTAETVDKRQRLFTFIKKNGTIIDCSVTAGAGTAAQNEQKEILKGLMSKTLTEFNKKIEPRAIPLFFEKVGFYPVAIVVETEKLVHYVGERETITCKDLEEIVGRSREDALFELTDAFGKRQIARTMTILTRLQEQGIHGLAILATMRNFFRKQLFYCSLQMRDTPRWHRNMNAREFQNNYLPALKTEGIWKEMLQGHPYALFMSFSRASEFSCSSLKQWLTLLLDAEFRLKGSPVPAQLVLEELFLSMLKTAK